jgi:hypothetical protein
MGEIGRAPDGVVVRVAGNEAVAVEAAAELCEVVHGTDATGRPEPRA